MIKKYSNVLLFSVVIIQAQQTSWQKNIKSNSQDFLSQISTTLDGQYLLSGSSIQKINPFSNQNLGYDFHILKMNQQGQIVWDKYFGGDKHDFLNATVATQDGGFMLVGTSQSNIGFDKTSKLKGGSDIWAIRIDENGEELWQKTLGTSADEEAISVVQTTELGYLVAGSSQNKEESFGSKDSWIVKLDKNGNVLYQLMLGGQGIDEVKKIIPTKDGGALIGIYSRSFKEVDTSRRTVKERSIDVENDSRNTQDKNSKLVLTTLYEPKTSNHFGEGDYWIVKLNKEGKVEWQKSFGGKEDEHLRSMSVTDQGYIIAGESRSGISGTKKTSQKEGTDLWIIALDFNGEELWQKSYSFGNRDVMMSLDTITDATGNHTKGFLLGGFSMAEGKAKKNDETFWLLYLDSKGEEVWRKYVEGKERNNEERLVDAKLNNDGTFILAGTSAEELGKENWKVVKLADAQLEQLIEKQDMRVYPNPVEDYCYVEIGIDFKEATISLYDMSGKLTFETKTQNRVTKINTRNLPQGIYVVSINTEKQKLNRKIVKK